MYPPSSSSSKTSASSSLTKEQSSNSEPLIWTQLAFSAVSHHSYPPILSSSHIRLLSLPLPYQHFSSSVELVSHEIRGINSVLLARQTEFRSLLSFTNYGAVREVPHSTILIVPQILLQSRNNKIPLWVSIRIKYSNI